MTLNRMSTFDAQLVRQIHTMDLEDRRSVRPKLQTPSKSLPRPSLDHRPTLRRKRAFWTAPQAADHGESHQEPNRSETWLELFLDLVFVAAVTNLGEVSACALDAKGIFSTYLLFSALNHIWISLTIYANRFEGLDVFHVAIFGLLSLAGCLYGLHLRSGDGVVSSVTELGVAKNCTRLAGTSTFDILEVSAYPAITYTVCLALLAGLYLKVAVSVEKEKKGWMLESASFVIEACFWGASIGTGGWVRTVLWGSGRLFKLLANPGIAWIRTSPLHVGHLHGRMNVFVLLYLGESIIQIITAPVPESEGGYYQTTAALSVGICFNFAITYLHTQPHHAHEHVIAKHPKLAFAWMAIHTEALLFTVFLTSVGIKLLFQGLLTPFLCGGPEYLLLCVGVGGSNVLANVVRFLHKGCNSEHQHRRLGSYIYRLFIAILCLLCPIFFGLSAEHKAVVLLTPIFLLGLLTVAVDTFAGSNQEIAKELLDHGLSLAVHRDQNECQNSVTGDGEGRDQYKAPPFVRSHTLSKAISFALLPDLFGPPATLIDRPPKIPEEDAKPFSASRSLSPHPSSVPLSTIPSVPVGADVKPSRENISKVIMMASSTPSLQEREADNTELLPDQERDSGRVEQRESIPSVAQTPAVPQLHESEYRTANALPPARQTHTLQLHESDAHRPLTTLSPTSAGHNNPSTSRGFQSEKHQDSTLGHGKKLTIDRHDEFRPLPPVDETRTVKSSLNSALSVVELFQQANENDANKPKEHEALDLLASLTHQLPFKKRVLNTLWRRPQPCQEWGEKTHFRHESWYELFFDLMFVGCCLALGGVIKCALSPAGLLVGYLLFSALTRTWIGFTTYINKFDSGHVFHLVSFGIITLCVGLMGLYMAPASGHDCSAKPDDVWDVVLHVRPMIVSNAVAQVTLGALYLQVAYFYPANGTHWLMVAMSYFINATFWLASLTGSLVAMPILWLVGHFISHVVEWFSFLTPSNAPLHIPLMNTRMGMFVMLMLGESVIQIVIAGLPSDQLGAYFELSTTIAFLTAFNFAVHYFHTQPKTPSQHILRRSISGTWLFYRLHKNMAYFILLMGVGFKAINTKLSFGLYPNDPYYWLLCSGAGVATFLTLGLRMLNQPRSTWQKIEKLNYVLVFIFAALIQVLPAALGPDKLGVFFLVLPVFLLSSVVAFSVFFLRDTADQHLSFVAKEAVSNMGTLFDVDDH